MSDIGNSAERRRSPKSIERAQASKCDNYHADRARDLMINELPHNTLSPYVKSLLNLPRLQDIPLNQSKQPPTSYAFQSWMTVCEELEERLGEIPHVEVRDERYYQRAVTILAPPLQQIYQHYQNDTVADHQIVDGVEFSWLCVKPSQLQGCVTDGRNDKRAIRYCACLGLTSILERSIQDLHWSQFGHTPTMLKELLCSDHLEKLLGCNVMKFLNVIVGPPTSLNIRNLLWHGFGSSAHDEAVESFYWIVFFCVHWIGFILHRKNITVSHRQFQSIDTEPIASLHKTLLSRMMIEDFDAGSLPVWAKPSDFQQCVEFIHQNEFGKATILLLVTFEHMMRIVFCLYNDCLNRQMTAVQSQYFTTLDHVLEEYLDDGETRNRLYDYLPSSLRSALCDLLSYPDGLRLRDRLSHMEISYSDISESLCLYSFNVVTSTIGFLLDLYHGGCSLQVYLIESYIPIYHPLSILYRSCEECQDMIVILNDLSTPEQLQGDVNKLYSSTDRLDTLPSIRSQLCMSEEENMVTTLKSLLCTSNLFVSSKFKTVAEWCKLLQAIVINIRQTVDGILDFHEKRQTMISEKTLRSRQRKNYVTFLSLKPALVRQLRELLDIVLLLRNNMSSDSRTSATVRKPHKALLQLTENINSQLRDCKWLQAVEYYDNFVQTRFKSK